MFSRTKDYNLFLVFKQKKLPLQSSKGFNQGGDGIWLPSKVKAATI
jgi:hypothetical protein